MNKTPSLPTYAHTDTDAYHVIMYLDVMFVHKYAHIQSHIMYVSMYACTHVYEHWYT